MKFNSYAQRKAAIMAAVRKPKPRKTPAQIQRKIWANAKAINQRRQFMKKQVFKGWIHRTYRPKSKWVKKTAKKWNRR